MQHTVEASGLSDMHVAAQMYLDNGGTGDCECCYPNWASSTPDYTFLIQDFNSTSMPGLWSYNVGSSLILLQQTPA